MRHPIFTTPATTLARLRRAGLAAAAALVCLVAVACGSSGNGGGSAGTSPGTPAGSSAAGASTPAASTQSASLLLDWTWQPYHLPFMYGTSFADEGISLSLTQGQGSGTSATLVGQDKYQFGFVDTSTAMISEAKGVPIQNILAIQQSGAFATECWKSANVHSPKDLAGHTVLMVPAESTAQVWPAYLAANGVSANSVHVVSATVSNKVTLMISHRADCMAGLLGQDTLQAQLANSGIAAPMPWSDNGVALFGYSLIASQSVINDHPDLVRKVVAATIDSWQKTCADQPAALAFFAEKHPELARTDTEKAYNTGNLKAACDQVKPPAGMNGKALGPADPKQWDAALAILKKYGGLNTSKPASDFYTNQFLPTS